jgi:hypothetical protein
MNIGYAQAAITPSLERPVYLAGFGQNRRAESVHDDLYARALALSQEGTTLVLCALDLIGLSRAQVQAALQPLQAPGRVLIVACTHTHHGPDTLGLWGPDAHTSGLDQAYLGGLREQIAAVISTALEGMQPAAGMKAGSVLVRGVVKNARDPHILDEELTLLQLVGPDRQALVSLFNFPCHPEVLWEHNPQVTSDYPGVLRRQVEQRTDAPCLFFAGALGGMLTPDVQDHSFEDCQRVGLALAQAGLEALEHLQILPAEALAVRSAEVPVRLTNPLFKLAFQQQLMPDLRDKTGRIHTQVNLVKVGPLWLATVPGELLPKLGLALKASLQQAGAGVAGVIGLADDELGYILPAEDFRYPLDPFNPGKHYEETMSISKEVGPKVMDALASLL